MTAFADPPLAQQDVPVRFAAEPAEPALPADRDVPTAATRHLSAAAYLDEEFCRRAVLEVYHQRRRLAAPSYGFDLPTVLHHCRRARAGYVWRDAGLTTTIVVAVLSIIGIPALVALAALLVYLRQAREAGRRIREAADAIRSATNDVWPSVRTMLESVTVSALLLVPVGVCVAVLYSPVAYTVLEVLPVAGREAERMLTGVRAATVVLALGVFALTVGSNVWRQRRLDTLAPDRPIPSPRPSRRLAEIAHQQGSIVTVYSGSHPFVGSGLRLADWGTSIRLVKAGEQPASRPGPAAAADEPDTAPGEGREFDRAPFDVVDLVEYVRRRLLELIGDWAEEDIAVESRVFRSATRMTDRQLWPSEQDLHQVMRSPTERARHYLACRVVSRGGELVTQVYLAFGVERASLYTELTAYALVPCEDRYRVVSKRGGTGPAAQVRACWWGIMGTPEMLALAPLRLAGALLDRSATLAGRLPRIRRRYRYDRGAVRSLRELASARVDQVAFCHSDIRRHLRTIERQAIAVIYEFLEQRGVDITEYRQRTITILNEGILNTGVLTSEGAIVAGREAQVNTTPVREQS